MIPVVAVWVIAQATALPQMKMRVLEGNAEHFRLSLEAPERSMRALETHVRERRIVLFVPKTKTRASEHVLPSDLIGRVVVKPAKRGTVIVLETRLPAAEVISKLTFPSRAPWVIQTKSVTRALTKNSVAKPRPFLKKSTTSSQEENPETKTSRVLQAATVPDAVAWLALALGFLSLVAWWIRRKHGPLGSDASIDVVAVQSLGGKHRLALVEACGGRFLLATSDKDVRLLGSISGSFEGVMHEASTPVLGISSEARKSTDIEGLLQLRQKLQRGQSEVAA